ncbi:hypothetical protein Sste5346_000463 [Sporothrix stenoceras]|uniref:Uncharacterized protein n=1 Tax=Sporothrix stenoceras TaxID=5173 RepID=A0ABR3ZTY9_9PEZI
MTYSKYYGAPSNPYFPNKKVAGTDVGHTLQSSYEKKDNNDGGSGNSNNRHNNKFNGNTKYNRSNTTGPYNRPSKNAFFSGEGPSYRGDGKDSRFDKHRKPLQERKPFSSTMPFTINFGAAGKEESAEFKAMFAEDNPTVSGEGLYMDFLFRSWSQMLDRLLSKFTDPTD